MVDLARYTPHETFAQVLRGAIPFFWGMGKPEIYFGGSSRSRWRHRIQVLPSMLGAPEMLGEAFTGLLGGQQAHVRSVSDARTHTQTHTHTDTHTHTH